MSGPAAGRAVEVTGQYATVWSFREGKVTRAASFERLDEALAAPEPSE